jgi:hypothetical protein
MELGCIMSDPFDELRQHFSSPPRRHLHIVVQLSHDGEYPRYLFMFFILLINAPCFTPAHPHFCFVPFFFTVRILLCFLLF